MFENSEFLLENQRRQALSQISSPHDGRLSTPQVSEASRRINCRNKCSPHAHIIRKCADTCLFIPGLSPLSLFLPKLLSLSL